jgi:hypothetical protein
MVKANLLLEISKNGQNIAMNVSIANIPQVALVRWANKPEASNQEAE